MGTENLELNPSFNLDKLQALGQVISLPILGNGDTVVPASEAVVRVKRDAECKKPRR